MDDLKEIGKKRRKLGLTQTELARKAGVSQSLVAKVEKGIIDVSYSKAKAIFETLEDIESERIGARREMTARDIMSAKVESAKGTDKISKAISIMKEKDYSQLPIFSKGICIGSISEQAILNAIQEGHAPKALAQMPVEEIMEDAFPMIPENTMLSGISILLKNNQAILAIRKGEIVGIITKADILKTIPK